MPSRPWRSAAGGRSLTELVWAYAQPSVGHGEPGDVQAQTDGSRALSRELKSLGFRFVGPTICYAFMQASGIVNDHLVQCFRHDPVEALRRPLLDRAIP